MNRSSRKLAAGAGIVALGILAVASSAKAADLEQIVADQARRIEELEAAQRRMQAQFDAERAVPAPVSPAPRGEKAPPETIDPEYVDARIEDFERAPVSRFLLSGYGTVGFVDVKDGMTAFGASFSPGFHFRMADSLHFNAEFEFEFEVDTVTGDLETHIELEFAQVDYLATDWLVLSGGKFLTPFNSFGPRLHPSWINKFASPPPIYGGHDSGGFIPVLANIGFMGSGGLALCCDNAKVNYAVYVGNGVTSNLSDPPSEDELLDLEFGNTIDLDDGVTFGGRMGVLPIGNLELGLSYMTGSPESARYHLIGTDAWYNWQGVELRGEFAYLTRQKSGVEGTVWGYWLQAAYRLSHLYPGRTGLEGVMNRVEPVIRWGEVLDFFEKNGQQLAVGLNYWLFESAPLKISYEVNDGAQGDNRFILQFAYGF